MREAGYVAIGDEKNSSFYTGGVDWAMKEGQDTSLWKMKRVRNTEYTVSLELPTNRHVILKTRRSVRSFLSIQDCYLNRANASEQERTVPRNIVCKSHRSKEDYCQLLDKQGEVLPRL